ncbi:MAG TPA: hypothetical protein VN879_16030 [Candidatus Acidoferrales bacterium]|nr:hypothetical protein [Candidatus Acidoferrales bacterium]
MDSTETEHINANQSGPRVQRVRADVIVDIDLTELICQEIAFYWYTVLRDAA